MPGLSKAEAARQMGISRTTLYKLIDEGKLSAQPDGTIDPTELVRAVSTLSTAVHRERLPLRRERSTVHREHIEVNTDTPGNEHVYPVHREHHEIPVDRPIGHQFTDAGVHREQLDTLREMIALLREQIERKDAQIAHLSGRLDQWEQRYDRLLTAPAPTATPAPAPVRPRWPADIHERILAYMREHPGPHTPQNVQDALGLPQTPRHVMRHLMERGRLTRPTPGRYAYTPK